jgi:hypothetical protein
MINLGIRFLSTSKVTTINGVGVVGNKPTVGAGQGLTDEGEEHAQNLENDGEMHGC